MTRIINLLGGPGAGKSTLAAQVFAQMKTKGEDVELVTEFAKDLVWNQARMDNQVAILGEQDNRLYRLVGKVKYVITDSPIILGGLYATGRHLDPHFMNHLLWAHRTYYNQNFLLKRAPSQNYSEVGRNQTHDGALELDTKIKAFVERFGIDYTEVNIGPYAATFIYEQIIAWDFWKEHGGYNGTN